MKQKNKKVMKLVKCQQKRVLVQKILKINKAFRTFLILKINKIYMKKKYMQEIISFINQK